MKSLLFRFDASSQIGIGHAFRCMAIIEELSLQGGIECIVIAKPLPKFITDKLISLNALIKLIKLNLSIENEVAIIESISNKYNSTAVLLDGYHFSSCYREQLFCCGFSVICFDDCNDLDFLFCHVLINALPVASTLGYEKSAKESTKLLGLEYSIIRREFLKNESVIITPRIKLLINFGGSDIANLTLPLITKLMEIPVIEHPFDVIVVTGGAYEKVQEIQELCNIAGFTHIHNCQNMSEVLSLCKMAICAPGSIVYELAYCRVPSIFLTVADNQLLSAKAHQSLGWCKVENGLNKNGIDLSLQHLEKLWVDQEKIDNMSIIASKLVDGKGVSRICDEIKKVL